MLPLEEVKEFLKIDFDDNDNLLKLLIAGAIKRAELITGLDLSLTTENHNEDIKDAMLDDIANRYSNLGSDEIGDIAIASYRRNSTRPMF